MMAKHLDNHKKAVHFQHVHLKTTDKNQWPLKNIIFQTKT